MRTLASFFAVLGLVSSVYAAPGDLDTNFSGDGKIIETALGSAFANAAAIQADGKIVVVGESAGDFAVVRYNRNGTLDTTFSGDGIVMTNFFGGSVDTAAAVAIQADGRIVVAGRAGSQSNPSIAIARYNTDGTLDTAFSGDGILTAEFGDGGGGARGVAIQADGKIVVVGSTGSDFAVARFNPNGTPDTGFGQAATGIVTKDFGSTAEGATAVAIQADGRIVVAGFTGQLFALERFLADGTREFLGLNSVNGAPGTSFGSAINVSAVATSMAIQADGRIVVVGDVITSFPGDTDISRTVGIARYNANGTLDTTFAGAGAGLLQISFVPASFASIGPPSFAGAVAIQPDNKIVVVGRVDATVSGVANLNFALARLNPFGSLDTTFNGDGLLTTDFSAGGTTRNDSGAAVAIQRSDGRIVVAGSAGANIALARYHAFTCNGANVTIVGTNGPDIISGTLKADVIHGLGGNDTIDGGGGNDFICGGGGTDILNGGPGNDTLLAAGLGTATLNGGDGTDVCLGSNTGRLGDTLDTFILCETINTGGAGVSGEWLDIDQHCNRSRRHPRCRIEGILKVFNPGTETTAVPSQVAFFLSEDEVLDENDSFLTTKKVGALDAGQERVVKLKLELPEGDDVSGFFVIAVVDFFDDVSERNEDNNVAVSPPITERRNRGNGRH